MMKFRWDILVFWVSAGLMILFAALIPVWNPFAIFMGLFLMSFSGIFTAWQYLKYKELLNKIEERRYYDAYVYADENNTNFDPENFAYPKKQERRISATKTNAQIMIIAGAGMFILGVFAFIFAFCSL
ncbi:MAG: hypothetical protein J6C13_04765 [Clostridia bacterium]|nr:hypothetical protein [Clostridia bacterium]